MGKGREKRRRKANKQRQETREERDLVKEKITERFERSDSPFSAVSAERADAERRAKLSPKYVAQRAGSDPPPIL
jgi:hypothetical protein